MGQGTFAGGESVDDCEYRRGQMGGRSAKYVGCVSLIYLQAKLEDQVSQINLGSVAISPC